MEKYYNVCSRSILFMEIKINIIKKIYMKRYQYRTITKNKKENSSIIEYFLITNYGHNKELLSYKECDMLEEMEKRGYRLTTINDNKYIFIK